MRDLYPTSSAIPSYWINDIYNSFPELEYTVKVTNQVTLVLIVDLHNSISERPSVQWNCYIPFAGFDPRATEIRKHDKVRETIKICEGSIGPTQEITHKQRMTIIQLHHKLTLLRTLRNQHSIIELVGRIYNSDCQITRSLSNLGLTVTSQSYAWQTLNPTWL
jgi:hypothetical protein